MILHHLRGRDTFPARSLGGVSGLEDSAAGGRHGLDELAGEDLGVEHLAGKSRGAVHE